MTGVVAVGEPYVDPDVRVLLDAADADAPDFWELTPAEARRAMDDMVSGMRGPVAVERITDVSIPGQDHIVPARLYQPASTTSGQLLVFFHGGGWVVGSVDTYDRPCRRLANDAGLSILSVDYRLAPEHPFPAGLDDCYTALEWIDEHAQDFGIDGSFVAVGGDSAGANLAAAVAQLSRDRRGPRIDHQVLMYPVVSRRFDTSSYRAFGTGYFLTQASMESFWNSYVGPERRPAYADLLAIGGLAGLPPATVVTCSLDPLRDEGEEYADRLAGAGVAVTLVRLYGLLHGIWIMDASVRRSYQFGLDLAGVLRRAAAEPPTA